MSTIISAGNSIVGRNKALRRSGEMLRVGPITESCRNYASLFRPTNYYDTEDGLRYIAEPSRLGPYGLRNRVPRS